MKKILFIFLFFYLLAPFITSSSWAATVAVEVIHSMNSYQAGESYPLLFRLKIQKPWYIHGATKSESDLIPTKLIFHDSRYVKVKDIRFPQAETRKFEYLPEPVAVYYDSIFVQASISSARDTPLGIQTIKGSLSYQACSSGSCLSPEELPLELQIMIVAPGTYTVALNTDLFLSIKDKQEPAAADNMDRFDAGLMLTLIGLFLGGLALNLTPCIYPLIPITVSYFGGRSQKASGNRILHGILYLSGLVITNSLLGVSSALTGSMLGSALQNPVVLIIIACFMTSLGLSFFGVWELRLPMALIKTASKNYSGYFGTIFMGLTLGIVAAPCLGPFILGLLTYVGQRGDPLLGFLFFLVLSIGMGLPLCVLAILSGAIDRLPLSGDWMIWIKKLLGWLLIGMGIYMIGPLIPKNIGAVRLQAVMAVISGIHLGWIDKSGGRKPGFLYFKKGISVLILAAGLFFFIYTNHPSEGIKWVPYNQEAMSAGLEEKRPVMLEIYADWCLPCKAMERKAFNDPEVVGISKNILCIRLDLTRKQPFQEEILKRYQVWGVPTIIFMDKEGKEERGLRIESYVDNLALLERMKSLLGS